MGVRTIRRGPAGLVAVVCLGALVLFPGVAAAAGKPAPKFATPVCLSGFDLSLNGTVNWKKGGPGTVAVDWGDATAPATALPAWHTYGSAGSYTVTLTATNAKGTGTATTVVTVGPGAATCQYTLTPSPMAESGTLGPDQSSTVALKVTNPGGKLVTSEEPVWLSFVPAEGGGTAQACCGSSPGEVALSSTPALFLTGAGGSKGEVLVTYTTAAVPPDSGSDVLTASPVPSTSSSGATSTSYEYSSSPVPLSPPNSIDADCSTDVSKPLGAWLRGLPPDADVEIPPGSCYEVNEGLSLDSPTDLTIDGGSFENESTSPGTGTGHGTVRGNPVFNVVGGSGLTLQNMTITGANPGGYLAAMAFASGVELQGTSDATLSNLDIATTFGDGITLDPLRNGANHKGSGIISATKNVTISNITIDGAGRMGIAFVSVNDASVSNVTLSDIGLDTFDVEADQGNEGSQNVTIDGCTATVTGLGDFFADGGSGSGNRTGNITVSDCTMTEAQAGTTIWVHRPTTGTNPRGPYLFENDTFDCGASTTVACVSVSGGTVAVTDCSFTFPGTLPAETVYEADTGATIAFTDDDVTGYGTTQSGDPGTNDATSTVTVVGGSWTPAS